MSRLIITLPTFAVALSRWWAWGWRRSSTPPAPLVIRLGWLRLWVDPNRCVQ